LRPVVLVGGHNGAGKTTILEAIRLCLYGRLALGSRVTDSEYERHLRERIHRTKGALIHASGAAITLEIEHSRAGERSVYTVTRSWNTRGATIQEQLSILRNGSPLENLDSQFWSDFVRSLVPPGLSQLFFFDGEKIQKLAEDDSEYEALGESIKALLGLDLVERLSADLDVYVSRKQRELIVNSGASQRLKELDQDAQRLQEEIKKLHEEEAHHRTQAEHFASQVTKAEHRLAQGGEGLASKRGELREGAAILKTALVQVEDELRTLFEGALPFAACPTLSAQVSQQLAKEAALERFEASSAETAEALRRAAERLTKGSVAQRLALDAQGKKEVTRALTALATELGELPADLRGTTRLHQVSSNDRDTILGVLKEASNLPSRVSELTVQLLRVEKELGDTQVKLNMVPDSNELTPLVKELARSQEKLARHEADLKFVAESLQEKQKALTQVARERARLEAAESSSGESGGRLALVGRVRTTLDRYLAELTQAKVTELEKVATECFQRLCRKAGLVSAIRISVPDFRTTLLDAVGRELPKKDLSAGEKQIYAISLLWGLAKVSGRPLPMIVDTPLGRLDSHHRSHLVSRYFSVAAHQVVILSTDTEIDEALFAELKPAVSHSIRLVNHAEGWTEVEEGYFWQEGDHAAA
jgi:DNA sulfur modification protein DndD